MKTLYTLFAFLTVEEPRPIQVMEGLALAQCGSFIELFSKVGEFPNFSDKENPNVKITDKTSFMCKVMPTAQAEEFRAWSKKKGFDDKDKRLD